MIAAQTSKAQVDVTIQPLALIFGTFNASVDFGISESFSLEGIVGFTSRSDSGTDADTGEEYEYDYTGFPVTLVAKYYMKPRQGADRFYLSGFLRYINRKAEFTQGSDNADFTWTRFGIGFGIGSKFVSKKGVLFDLGLGIGKAFHNEITYEENGDHEEVDWPGVMFLPRLAIGYRFGK